jgi:uncharacterized protein YjiS (DUF1127 family)
MHDTLTHATARITGMLHTVFWSLRRRYRESRLTSALQSLSDAQLKDIGVYRCEIPHVAHARCAAPGRS